MVDGIGTPLPWILGAPIFMSMPQIEDVEFYIVLDTWLARFSEGPGWISENCGALLQELFMST